MFKILNKINCLHLFKKRQRGAALMVMLVILILGASAMLLNSLNSVTPRLAREKITADALAQAKEALIGYAVKVQISNSNFSNQPRPGDLPCPDNHPLGDINEGSPSTPCSSNALGRLPWKKLGLPDLHDGSGERLWYAVSTNFKDSLRIGILNSDTVGTITVRAPDGSLLNDGSNSSGAAALIIAPGYVLQRTDKPSPQDRSSTGYIDPENYLDIANGENNAAFTDNSVDGFIQGSIKDANNHMILNDQILVITQDNIMQGIQKRVAAEVRNCLINYALSINNNGRYPWAAPITDLGTTYNDSDNKLFGRIPDDLSNTDSGTTMNDQWGACKTHSANTPSTWWKNWKELVFYGLSDKYSPNNPSAPSFPATCNTAGNCISINNSSTPAKFVVIVAGKKLANPDQSLRDANSSNRSNAYYFLEGGNQNADQSGSYTFIQSAPSSTFNDTVVFQ